MTHPGRSNHLLGQESSNQIHSEQRQGEIRVPAELCFSPASSCLGMRRIAILWEKAGGEILRVSCQKGARRLSLSRE
jgi:hypothetical protein